MSQVEFKELALVMSLIFFPMLIGFMLHVDIKKRPWCPVEFKGQGPHPYPPPPPTVLGRSSPLLTRVTMVTKRALSQHCNKTTTWGPEGQRSRGLRVRGHVVLTDPGQPSHSPSRYEDHHTHMISYWPRTLHTWPLQPPNGPSSRGYICIWIRVSMYYYKRYFKYLHRHCS